MYITRYTDYSLRVLIYLAVAPEQLTTIAEISHKYDISKNHLMKIVQELNTRGYLLATRGKNGGIKLKTNAADINIGKLVRELEQNSKLVECFGENNLCVITPNCQLKHIFAEALESFYSTLDNYNLADILSAKDTVKLAEILTIKIA